MLGVDAVSFDWLDGALFFQVMSANPMEGVANLDGTATTRRVLQDFRMKQDLQI